MVSTEEKADVARAAGADEAVLVDGFLAAVKELTGGAGVDVVVDVVGGDLMTDSLRPWRRWAGCWWSGSPAATIPQVKVNRLLLNNIDVRGVGWGAYAMARPGFMRDQWDALVPMMESGVVDPPIGSDVPGRGGARALEEMERAHGARQDGADAALSSGLAQRGEVGVVGVALDPGPA